MPYWELIPPLILSGIGFSFAMPATQSAVLTSVAREHGGKASGAFSMIRQLGGALRRRCPGRGLRYRQQLRLDSHIHRRRPACTRHLRSAGAARRGRRHGSPAAPAACGRARSGGRDLAALKSLTALTAARYQPRFRVNTGIQPPTRRLPRFARTAGLGGSLAGNSLRCKHDAESSSSLRRHGGCPPAFCNRVNGAAPSRLLGWVSSLVHSAARHAGGPRCSDDPFRRPAATRRAIARAT